VVGDWSQITFEEIVAFRPVIQRFQLFDEMAYIVLGNIFASDMSAVQNCRGICPADNIFQSEKTSGAISPECPERLRVLGHV